jgi:RNase P subunit RPR2
LLLRLYRRFAVLALVAVALGASTAFARPGGGSTFSAPSRPSTPSRSSTPSTPSRPSTPSTPSRPSTPSTPSWPSTPSSPSYPSSPSSSGDYSPSSGGGGSSSGGDFFIFLLIVAVAVVLLVVIVHHSKQQKDKEWSAGERLYAVPDAAPPPPLVTEPMMSKRTYLEGLRKFDPAFSLVLFEDFLYTLFARVHEARGKKQLDLLAGYLAPSARRALQQGGALAEIKAIVVASFEITGVIGLKKLDSPNVRVALAFTANYTEVYTDGTEQSFWVAEAWEVSRKRETQSKAPDAVRTFGCPNCGAPLEAGEGTRCRYCKAQIDTGEFDWIVTTIEETGRQQRGPQLTGDTVEEGSDLPTVLDPDAKARLGALSERDPDFAWVSFQARVGLIFSELQVAWSKRAWKHARPFVSDSLFQSQSYWMRTYASQKLRNITENSRILGVQIAKITSDQYFDAITVRVFATGLDYTIDETNERVVSGSKTKERYYTEYWTLIRGAGRTGAARSDLACPNCGAPLDISMAGSCEHCQAKVSSGQFDWVLSRIEQDEAYVG